MSIWNKILIGFVFVGLIAFFYLSTRTLAIQANWRKSVLDHQAAIQEELAATEILIKGDPEDETHLGITQTKLQLHHVLMNRGRVWYSVTPNQVQAQGEVLALVTVDAPDPHQISVKTTLQAFEERDVFDGGQYLGEFIVMAVTDKQLELKPSLKLRPAALQRLQASQGTWTLYEVMPADNPEMLAKLTEDELKSALPESLVGEFMDEEGNLRKDRKLRDYNVLFRIAHRRNNLLNNEEISLTQDLTRITSAADDAKAHLTSREKVALQLKAERDEEQRKRDAVADHLKKVEAMLASMKQSTQQLADTNRRLAASIANAQRKATEAIDARSRDMAQADAGR